MLSRDRSIELGILAPGAGDIAEVALGHGGIRHPGPSGERLHRDAVEALALRPGAPSER
jgi:hypothetical protein